MEYTTKDLQIRPFLPGDREAMAALLTDKIVAKTYMLPDFACAAEAEKMFDRLMELSARNDRFICAICLNGQCIGMVNDTEIKGMCCAWAMLFYRNTTTVDTAPKCSGELLNICICMAFPRS